MEISIVVPQYPKQICLSKSRKAKYIELIKVDETFYGKWPKCSKKEYRHLTAITDLIGIYDTVSKRQIGVYQLHPQLRNRPNCRYYLLDNNLQPVISNKRTVGTPKMMPINFQEVYSGMNPNIRIKLMQEIKASLVPHFENFPVMTEYPIAVTLTIEDVPGGADLDNRAFLYIKSVFDLLVTGRTGKTNGKEKIISFQPKLIDDTTEYIQGINIQFVPIENEIGRKLIFKFQSINGRTRNTQSAVSQTVLPF